MKQKHDFQVGDLARSIETGWLGRILEIDPDQGSYEHEGKTYEFSPMCKMEGFDRLAWTVAGGDLFDYCDHADVQWFATNDLRYVKVEVPA